MLAIALNLNFIEAFELCRCNFATQRDLGFLSSTLPSSEWAEDVMKSDNPSFRRAAQDSFVLSPVFLKWHQRCAELTRSFFRRLISTRPPLMPLAVVASPAIGALPMLIM